MTESAHNEHGPQPEKVSKPLAVAMERLNSLQSLLKEDDPFRDIKQDLISNIRGVVESSNGMEYVSGVYYFFPKNNDLMRAQRIVVREPNNGVDL